MNDINILIADDEEIMRDTCRKILEKGNYNLEIVEDGRKALGKLEEVPFDIAIVDLKMPHVSGIDVLESIKRKNRRIKVIMITAYATVDSAVEAMKKGAYDYIAKPFTPDELRIIVKRAVNEIRLYRETKRLRQELKEYKTKGQMEEEISKAIRKFQKDYHGKGPEDIKSYIMDNMILVRLKGTLSLAEKELIKTKEGISIIKRMEDELGENSAKELKEIIKRVTTVEVTDIYTDLSAQTEEKIRLFILDKKLDWK